jgi:hypothetical protein
MDVSRIGKIAALAAVVITAAVVAGSASAYDRRPVTGYGLYPDGWYQTVTNAERNLHYRYPGIKTAYCLGVQMSGHYPDSSMLRAGVRWWDKLACGGYAYGTGSLFTLVFDQKSLNSWTIYRLHGASVSELYGGSDY